MVNRVKTVYVAHPLRGDVQGNRLKVNEICKQLSQSGEVIPFSPLHAFGYLEPVGDQTSAMQHCFALLAAADEQDDHCQPCHNALCCLEWEKNGQKAKCDNEEMAANDGC